MDLLNNIDSFLITNPTNILYLTGFVGAAPEEREAYVLLTRNKKYLFTNALYLEQAKKLNVAVVEISRENPFAKVFKRTLLAASQGESLQSYRLGFEEVDVTVAEYQKLKQTLKGVTLVPTRDRVEELRMIKRDDEIKHIRQAVKITDACFDVILGKIRPGITESEIAWEIESFFRKRGAGASFSPIVAFGSHTSQPHYHSQSSLKRPRLSRLGKRDIILVDLGARINGYHSDMTRVVFVGKPNDEWRRAYEAVCLGQQAALEYLQRSHPARQGETFHGRSGAAADRIARNVIKRAGFPPYPHSLGHGVGLAIHEQPRLSYKKPFDKLRAGMVITIEPAIYVEGRYGIRLEDLVLLINDGLEILSKSSKKLAIL